MLTRWSWTRPLIRWPASRASWLKKQLPWTPYVICTSTLLCMLALSLTCTYHQTAVGEGPHRGAQAGKRQGQEARSGRGTYPAVAFPCTKRLHTALVDSITTPLNLRIYVIPGQAGVPAGRGQPELDHVPDQAHRRHLRPQGRSQGAAGQGHRAGQVQVCFQGAGGQAGGGAGGAGCQEAAAARHLGGGGPGGDGEPAGDRGEEESTQSLPSQ
jgi:hypothetical protein